MQEEVSCYDYAPRKSIKNKVFSLIITIIILSIIILSGPANALNINFMIGDSEINKGEKNTFSASIDIDSEEFIDIDYLTLEITGPVNLHTASCVASR
ncbi:MAG: hypothetical protein AABW81_00090 [Nanoarchaeota archaeon]